MNRLRSRLAVLAVAVAGTLGGLAASGTFSTTSSGIIFQATFDSGAPGAAFGHTPQCLNTSGQQNPQNSQGTSHYFGDIYIDNGTTSSPTPGRLFNLAGSQTVPPGQGTASARYVIPVTPSGYGRAACTLIPSSTSPLHQNATPPNDLGQTVWYGLMVYAPPGETLGTTDAQGAVLWEYHFNATSGNSFSIGLVSRGGVGGWSVTDSIESGACNFGSSTVPVTGCLYRSHPTSCSTFHPAPMFGKAVTCIQGPLYTVPSGQLQTGKWLEIIVGIKWATDTSGSITQEWRYKGSSTWTPGWSGSGFPTLQWNAARYGNSATCPAGQSCGYANHEAVESYSAHEVGHPYSLNIDNVVAGTSKTAVEATMP